jgi:hypothetical protein
MISLIGAELSVTPALKATSPMPTRSTLSLWFVSRFRTSSTSVLIVFLFLALTMSAFATERIELEVGETAGLARRGFPTRTLVKLPRAVPVSTKFRLVSDGKPIVAQFRPDRDESTANWWLDFQSDMSPNERKRFQVEFGDDVTEVPELSRGHKLTKLNDGFSITHAPYISWKFPADLKGLISSVAFESFEWMRVDSPGLLLRDRKSQEYVFTGTGKIIREGHMSVSLRYEKTQTEASLQNVRSTVDLTLPGPVSWVEVEWSIDDPFDKIAALGLQINLNLDRSDTAPTLVDFGTTGVVYLSLYPGQETELVAESQVMNAESAGRPSWEIVRRDAGRVWQFAAHADRSKAHDFDGWAHVMDRKKCLALAIDAFARDTRDRIGVTADGRVTVWREYPAAQQMNRKYLRLWLHFIYFPPQSSAGTSPQQMQTPLDVRFPAQ